MSSVTVRIGWETAREPHRLHVPMHMEWLAAPPFLAAHDFEFGGWRYHGQF